MEVLGLVKEGKIADLAYWMRGINSGDKEFLYAQTGNDYGKEIKSYSYHYKDFFSDMLTMCMMWGQRDVLEFFIFDDLNLHKEEMFFPKLWDKSGLMLDGTHCLNTKEGQACAELALLNNIYWDIADCKNIPYNMWTNVFGVLKDDKEKLKKLEQAFFISVDIPNISIALLKEHNPAVYQQYLRFKDLLLRFELKEMLTQDQNDVANNPIKNNSIKKM